MRWNDERQKLLEIIIAICTLLAALKIFNVITWSWWWVMSPLWIFFISFFLAFLFYRIFLV